MLWCTALNYFHNGRFKGMRCTAFFWYWCINIDTISQNPGLEDCTLLCDYFYKIILLGCLGQSFCISLCFCYTLPIHCIHALIDLRKMQYLTNPTGHSWANETLLKVSAVAPSKYKAVCNMRSWARERSSKWFAAWDSFLAINGTCKCRFHRL